MSAWDDVAFPFKAKRTVEKLRAALQLADAAINPKDREGISLHDWNKRLKSATGEIRAAIDIANGFLG